MTATTPQIQIRLAIREEADVVVARNRARGLARREGLAAAATEAMATAISEVARNIVVHAGRGEILLGILEQGERRGIVVVARDDGPGIADPGRAMLEGYSTARGLGLGLPSARGLMDEFELVSAPAAGTTVTMTKWLP